MHSRFLRSEANILNKCLSNNAYLAHRASRLPRIANLQSRRAASIVPSSPPPEAPERDNDPEKPSMRPRGRPKTNKGLDSKSGESSSSVSLPTELADTLLWLPEENTVANESSLPPEEMLQEALSNLHVSFHPKTQHRATYASSAGPPVEPTVTLYSPIEGGTYVIDAAVQELARRVDADVLVLDALDLLAGEWGPFGKAAAALQLPSNPLQLGEIQYSNLKNPGADETDDEGEFPHPFTQVIDGFQGVGGGGRPPFGITIRTRRAMNANNSISAKKAFFQEFVNLQRGEEEAPNSFSSPTPSASTSTSAASTIPTPSPPTPSRPRIIYCRDLHLLSESLPHWYQQFIEAVRLRRQGPMPRPQHPVLNPTVVVLGVSPSIITPRTTPASSEPGGLVNFNTSRSRPQARSPIAPPAGPKVVEWDESPAAQRARDRRLHERLSNWEKYDASVFYPELPSLQTGNDGPGGPKSPVGRGLMSLFVAIPEGGGGPPSISPFAPEDDSSRERGTDHSRLTVVLPRTRDASQELATRVQRRLQTNQINMRTAVGGIGGNLSQVDELSPEKYLGDAGKDLSPDDERMRAMLLDWSQRVETWTRTKAIADRAMGSFVVDKLRIREGDKTGLDLTPLPWSAVAQSWDLERSSRTSRKDFLSTFTTKPSKRVVTPDRTHNVEEDEDAAYESESDAEISDIEELIEQLKRDPTLDQHEQRLLGSIVNPRHMPTTFAQVHLPAATIDSIRTIVSLPLLHPSAFGYGILKQHGMNGALLFGAPGTGKTLSIRALAKESGARMMIIKPSDVMDMFVGEGEKLVRAVFSLARRISPCVIFLDEIDALLGARYSSRGGGGDLAHRGVITEFMQEMDGLRTHKDSNVIVIGATNRPFDLDDAVLRRLPRRLLIDLPGEKERTAILRILLTDEQLADDVNVSALAKRTESFSGSDLKHLCVAAALDAVKEHAKLPWSVPQDTTPTSNLDGSQNHVDGNSTSTETSMPTTRAEIIIPADGLKTLYIPAIEILEPSTSGSDADESSTSESEPARRVLRMAHFEKALKEITPSASEQMGTLADLRKWNEEFGEGGRKRGNKIWGVGKFGFIVKGEDQAEEGRVKQP